MFFIKEYINNVICRMNNEELDDVIYDYIDEHDNIESLNVNNIDEFCVFYMSLAESVNRINMDLDVIDIYENLRNMSISKHQCNNKALSFILALNNILFDSNINLYNIELKNEELYKELFELLERQGL